jgi:hypothetical protein
MLLLPISGLKNNSYGLNSPKLSPSVVLPSYHSWFEKFFENITDEDMGVTKIYNMQYDLAQHSLCCKYLETVKR